MKKMGLPEILILCGIAFAGGVFWGFLGGASLSKGNDVQPVQVQPQVQKRQDIPVDGFPSIGPDDAPIVIVEFSDFQCPYCARFHDQTLQPLLDAYPGKIRFVYRHLPLTSIHFIPLRFRQPKRPCAHMSRELSGPITMRYMKIKLSWVLIFICRSPLIWCWT